jgi:hypothetical protein
MNSRPPTRIFYHAGQAGDLIYGLAVIQALGGGELRLHPPDALHVPGIERPMDQERVAGLSPFIETQAYITRCCRVENVEVRDGEADLNTHRQHGGSGTIVDFHFRCQRLPSPDPKEPWLTVDCARQVAKVVIHRSLRYQNTKFPWDEVRRRYGNEAIMVGWKAEHEAFVEDTRWPIAYYKTTNYLELARVIAGSQLFIGNQSSPYAVAEGLKHATIQETSPCPELQNCIFERPHAQYFRNAADIAFPDIV